MDSQTKNSLKIILPFISLVYLIYIPFAVKEHNKYRNNFEKIETLYTAEIKSIVCGKNQNITFEFEGKEYKRKLFASVLQCQLLKSQGNIFLTKNSEEKLIFAYDDYNEYTELESYINMMFLILFFVIWMIIFIKGIDWNREFESNQK